MKIRDFLKGVDPEECGSNSFYKDGKPYCPLAKAGANYGFEGPGSYALEAFAKKTLQINVGVYDAFWNAFDRSIRHSGGSLTKAFNKALLEAECVEKAKKVKTNENS